MAIVVDGLIAGTQLALLAVGMTLVFGLAGVLNLAYGQMVVIVAVIINLLIGAGVGVPIACAIGLVAGGVIGWGVDATVLRPLRGTTGESRVVLGLLVTLAIAFIIDGLVVWTVPYTALSVAVGWMPVDLIGVRLRAGSLVAFVVAVIALAATWILLATTSWGRQIRAVSADEQGAQLTGIDPAAVRRVVMVASGLIAAVVAIARGLSSSVGAADGFDLTVMALIVAVVGGLGRVGGAWAAGLALGVVHAAMTAWIGTAMTTVVMLTVAAVAILVRRGGLVGRPST
ncbi:MAG: branched-chain amino acid ABC transporter permease [Nitriliruptoraceae bacterium]